MRFSHNEMIYVSVKGKVLGEFEESAVRAMLAEGKITGDALYWREGMSGRRPVADLAKTSVAGGETVRLPEVARAPVIVALRTPAVDPGAEAAPVKPAGVRPAIASFGPPGTKPFTPRSARVAGAPPVEAKPGGASNVVVNPAFVIPLRAEAEKAAAPAQAPVAVKVPAPVAVAGKAPRVAPGAETVLIKPAVVKPASAVTGPPGTKLFLPRHTTMKGAAVTVAEPLPSDAAAPNEAAAAKAAPVPPIETERGEALPVAAAPKKRGRLFSGLAGLLVVAGVAGGGAWWWLNAAPAPIPGSVVLGGDEVEAVEIRVFRREDLAGLWRERLAAADVRSVELDQLMVGAQAAQRENELMLEVAARVFELGQEYNMPDLEELRAERDAKEAGAASARAALEKLQSEKAALPNMETLFEGLPDPLQVITADAEGKFTLLPPEGGEVVLLAMVVSETDGKRERRGWLEVLQFSPEGEAPGAVRFAETNRLDVEEIRRFVATGAP